MTDSRPSAFTDDKTFRTGDGSTTFEVLAPSRPDRGFVVSVESWDSPEVGMRLTRDAALALREWLSDRLDA